MSIIQGTSKAAGGGYAIDQSIRFNSADSAYLEKTYSSSESTLTAWSFSAWVKRSLLADEQFIFQAGTTSANLEYLRFTNSDTIEYKLLLSSSLDANYITSQVFRDPGAWMHIYAYRSSTTFKLYINGSEVTDFSTSNAPGSSDGMLGKNVRHRIGTSYSTISNLFGGYLAEMNFVPGTAKAITDFGETNSDGVWIPKAYDGSYGTNGFYITGETASDLGEDFSGNGNDFTSSGLATTDQMLDTPTNNFAVQNYITQDVDNLNWSEGNLNILADSSSRWHTIPATIYPQSGKWGYQATIKSSTGYIMIGWTSEGDIEDGFVGGGKLFYQGTNSNCAFLYNFEAQKYVNNTQTFTGGLAGLATNDVVECLMDIDNGTISWKKNGSAYTSFTGLNTTDNPLTVPMVAVYGGSSYQVELDYGQGGYTPSDSDYKTICTANLATPSITDGSAHFQPTLYTGDGSSSHEINQTGNSTFEPSMVWIKSRSAATLHAIQDQVRGNFVFYPNLTNAEGATGGGWVKSFDSDGFTTDVNVQINDSGETFAAWQWKAAGSGSSNTDGSITSTVSANTTAGFSIVTYVGNSTSGATVGHGLGAVPKMMILKDRDVAENWCIYHEELGPTKFLFFTSDAAFTVSNRWNDTAPTSSVFTLGNETQVNATGRDYVVYCFAEVPAYSSIGSYTGNGSADGPFVYTGMTPEFVLVKRSNTTENWIILDNARSEYNVTDDVLYPNLNQAENANSTTTRVDNISNGFKVRGTNTNINASGSTYIYMAFAKHPFGGDGVAPATAR
jgi:hypothetical protein